MLCRSRDIYIDNKSQCGHDHCIYKYSASLPQQLNAFLHPILPPSPTFSIAKEKESRRGHPRRDKEEGRAVFQAILLRSNLESIDHPWHRPTIQFDPQATTIYSPRPQQAPPHPHNASADTALDKQRPPHN